MCILEFSVSPLFSRVCGTRVLCFAIDLIFGLVYIHWYSLIILVYIHPNYASLWFCPKSNVSNFDQVLKKH